MMLFGVEILEHPRTSSSGLEAVNYEKSTAQKTNLEKAERRTRMRLKSNRVYLRLAKWILEGND